MHIIGMIIWALVSILLAFWMIKKSYAVKLRNFRGRGTTTTATVTRITPGMYLLALFAWVPIFVVTRWLWSALTEHDSDPYHWSFWLLVFIGIILMLLSLLPKVSLIRFVRLIGIALVIWSILEIDGLGHHMPWSNTTQAAEETTAVDCTLVEGSLAKAELELFALKARLSDDKPNGDDVVRREVKNLQNRIKSLRENKGCDLPLAPASAPTVTITGTPSASAEDCTDTWRIEEADHTGNRWVADGIAAIRDAESDAEAREAAKEWTDEVKLDPVNLSGAIAYLLDKEVDPDVLVDGVCASEDAERYLSQIELVLADSRSITADDAPEQGTNSGVEDGRVVRAHQPGISGDRKAIKVVRRDGKVLWILGRCGQFVVIDDLPQLPEGPTDNPEEGKNASRSPLKGTDAPDERVRGVEPSAPATVIRPSSSSTSAPRPTQPVLPEDPPEVSDPVEAAPGITDAPPATGDPVEDCDFDGDGIPDDTCP